VLKREKRKKAPPWSPTKASKRENGEWRRQKFSCHPRRPKNLVVTSIFPLLFTKMPLKAAKLQNYHSGR